MSSTASKVVKSVVGILLAGGAAAGVYFWLYPPQPPPDYRAVPVELGDLTQVVTATGQLSPITNVQVGSQVSGIITNLTVDFNSVVKQGQLLAEIDSRTYRADLASTEADLASAQSALELAKIQAKRSAALRQENLVSASDDDTAQATMRQAEAAVQTRDAAILKAQANLAYCTIFCPIDGVVISRNVDVGQTVAASLNTPTLFLVANDLSKMQIDASVSEADVGGIEVGQEVSFSVDAFPYRTFSGKVRQIRNAAATNQNVITYDSVIDVSNADLRLKPGMTATANIIIAQRSDVLKIPNAALRFRPPDATNAPVAAPAAPAGGPGGGQPGAGPGGGAGLGRGRGGAGGAGRGGPGGGGGRGGGRQTRTVYLLVAGTGDNKTPQLKSVQVRAGISDGFYTEVTSDTLKEGDKVVVGLNTPDSSGANGAGGRGSSPFGGGNPFGGGGGRRGF